MLVLLAVMFVAMRPIPEPSSMATCANGLELIEGLCVPAGEMVVVVPPVQAAPTSAPVKRPKPKAALRTSHQILQDPLFGQPAALLTVTITNADEEYWCPEILWTWYDGTTSVQEGDCEPFQQAPPDEIAYKTVSRSIPRAMPSGQWTITAQLRKMGKVIQTLSIRITVAGGGQ